MAGALVHVALLLLLPPLMLGVIARTKALAAGRTGPPLLQPCSDLLRLLRKGAVYSPTTTWVFRAGPIASLAAVLVAGMVVPLASSASPFGFPGDVVAFAALLGLGRFATAAAALDTGSSFEGMGASREVAFASLAEPALYLSLATLCAHARSVAFGDVFGALPWSTWGVSHPVFVIVFASLGAVVLAENARVPVDDPATHLELTMVHEVMVLDHSGPDYAFVLYGAAVKLLVTTSLLVHLVLPIPSGTTAGGAALFVAGSLGAAALVGAIESSVARLRLPRVPQFLLGAGVLAAIGLAVLLYRGQA